MAERLRVLLAIVFVVLGLSSLAALAGDLTPFFKPGAVRALILSGRNNHDWRTTTPFLKDLLLGTGKFDVRVIEEPAGITSETLAPYQVLILDYCGPRWGESAEKAVDSFVKAGGGLVVVHGAAYGFNGLDLLADGHRPTGMKEPVWPEFRQMVGGYWSEQPAKGFHGQHHNFTVKYVDTGHPIAVGLPDTFVATDELYHGFQMLPDTKILASAYDAPERGGTGRQEPILWTHAYGKGRVFYTALGHEVPAMREPGFKASFLRGTEWAATGKVSLDADAGMTKAGNPVRVLVVTGGHDYQSSFYTLFNGQPVLTWDHAISNQEAFKKDLRKNYDVVVLYDMSQDLDEKGRENLKSFLESGKGMVVLHHAIADYQAWPWWSQEVVGGRYLLQAEGSTPGSTYNHDQDLVVQAAMDHPITAGLGTIHITDETYKGMWISPSVKVLLKTDHPTSDGPVAWISPYPKSRVVYLELGHDGQAYAHPSYRELVKRSVLWTAGSLEPGK